MARWSLLVLATVVPFGRGCLERAPRCLSDRRDVESSLSLDYLASFRQFDVAAMFEVGLFLQLSIVPIEVLRVLRTTSRRCREVGLLLHFLSLHSPRPSIRGGVRMARWSLLVLATVVPFGRRCLKRAPRSLSDCRDLRSPAFPSTIWLRLVIRCCRDVRSGFALAIEGHADRGPSRSAQDTSRRCREVGLLLHFPSLHSPASFY
jgi:hypothetical protein